MKNYILILSLLFFWSDEIILSQEKINKFIGTKACSMCHKSEKQGKQLDVWQNSKHANAYNTLLSDSAIAIAKQKNLPVAPSESAECLSCHASGFGLDAKYFDKDFKISDGVQCETCHGAGSNYKAMNIMKDKAKSIENGLIKYDDKEALETYCKTCHNEKSPTYAGFDFAEMWEKIKHPKPAK